MSDEHDFNDEPSIANNIPSDVVTESQKKVKKIRQAIREEEAQCCLKAIYYYVNDSNQDGEEQLYKIPHHDIGYTRVLVYETPTQVIAIFKGYWD